MFPSNQIVISREEGGPSPQSPATVNSNVFYPKKVFLLLLACLFLLTGCAGSAEINPTKLKAPAGFRVSVFADVKVSGRSTKPRLMALSPGGVLLVTSTSDGLLLALPDGNNDGRADRVVTVLSDLDAPHGIAFYQGKLYVAETGAVVRYDWNEAQLQATNRQEIVKLPRGGMHFTRTIVFHNDKLYVAAGADCNVCADEHGRAMVQEFNPDGSGGRIYARGLRNAVGLDVSPVTKTVWASDNGRDWLGDNLPPDEIDNLGTLGAAGPSGSAVDPGATNRAAGDPGPANGATNRAAGNKAPANVPPNRSSRSSRAANSRQAASTPGRRGEPSLSGDTQTRGIHIPTDFGWPYCYGKRVVDTTYPGSSAARCARTVASAFDLPAHSAALGIAFYTGTQFPLEYRNDLFVAFHGSWNRSVPTGYKVVRIRMNAKGEAQGMEDFLTGFVAPGETRKGRWMGRPMGVTVAPDGSLFVSDDAAGAIYRVSWTAK